MDMQARRRERVVFMNQNLVAKNGKARSRRGFLVPE
jgi:hypothetical protein